MNMHLISNTAVYHPRSETYVIIRISLNLNHLAQAMPTRCNIVTFLLLVTIGSVACTDSPPHLDFVTNMSFKRFMGIWYNVASLPNLIQRYCQCPQSLDVLESPLEISLSESCLIYGRNITSKSKAIASVDGYGNWTNWNGPLQAPYWIIKLDTEDYKWAVLGQPSRKGFWIFSRTPTMESSLLSWLLRWGTDNHFDLTDIEYPDQSCFTTGSRPVNLLQAE